MSLQSTVGLYRAMGVPGDPATPDQAVYTPVNYFAGEAVKAGTFCWRDAVDATAVTGKTTGTDAPLGFVQRDVVHPAYDVTSQGTLAIAENDAVTVAVKGDFYVKTTANCTAGGQVYVDKTSGAILAAAGDNGIAATGWHFVAAGKADDIVIISNWS